MHYSTCVTGVCRCVLQYPVVPVDGGSRKEYGTNTLPRQNSEEEEEEEEKGERDKINIVNNQS